MARKSRMSVLKRQREANKREREKRKAEKGAAKRERRHGKKTGTAIATRQELEDIGVITPTAAASDDAAEDEDKPEE